MQWSQRGIKDDSKTIDLSRKLVVVGEEKCVLEGKTGHGESNWKSTQKKIERQLLAPCRYATLVKREEG